MIFPTQLWTKSKRDVATENSHAMLKNEDASDDVTKVGES